MDRAAFLAFEVAAGAAVYFLTLALLECARRSFATDPGRDRPGAVVTIAADPESNPAMILSRNHRHFPFERVRSGSVATIGSFDGLHLGHQSLLGHVVEEARSRGVPAIVMSFEPTPKEFFLADSPPARLMRFREKFEALAASDVDIFFCPRFNSTMRTIAADSFIRQILVTCHECQAPRHRRRFSFCTGPAKGISACCSAPVAHSDSRSSRCRVS